MSRAQVDIMPSLYKCVVGVARFLLCCFWSGCVVSLFFRKRGRAPACCGGLGCVALMGWVALFSVALFSHQKQTECTYTGGKWEGGCALHQVCCILVALFSLM